MVKAILPDIILLLETMGKRNQINNALESLLQHWTFESMDANGQSGGLAMGWRTKNCICENIWILDSRLGLEVYVE